jgi:hypothetical protein
MAEFAVDDQAGRELDKAQIVIGVLLPTNKQAAEAVKPAVRHLHYPAARWVPIRLPGWGQRLRRARLGWDVRGVAMCCRRFPARDVIVAAVQAQVPRDVWRGFDDLRVEQVTQFLHVGAVGPGEDGGEGHALAVGQQVPLDAAFPRSVGFAPVACASPAPLFSRAGP